MAPTHLSHLECGSCGGRHDANRLQSRCGECAGPLLARYWMEAMPGLDEVLSRDPGQFRFPEMSPTNAGAETPTLGRGRRRC